MTWNHVAIIMDGNGRWARSRALPRWRGHFAGIDSVRDVIEGSPDLGIRTLTLYAFSSDNWQRPAAEVGRLFWLLREYCVKERDELVEKGVRLTAIGRRDRIPASALRQLEATEEATRAGQRLLLRLAIDYSSKWAIRRALREVSRRALEGNLDPTDISWADLDREIARGIPHPELLIRTGGEERLSDFLLWELAHAELYFTPVLWPDFRRGDLARALRDVSARASGLGDQPSVTDALVSR